MNPTPLKVIGKEACLQAKSFFMLSKYLKSKRRPNILWKEESKEIKVSMKVEDGGVYHKKYDGRCTKQRIRIPKGI